MAISVSPNGRNHYETERPADELLVGTIKGIVSFTRPQPGAPWRESGRTLEDHHVASIAVEPRSGAIIAGTHDDGVWVSMDSGRSWDRRQRGIPYLNTYGVNYVDAGDELRLYVGTDPAHIYVSTNLGETWTELTSLRQVANVGTWTFPAPPHYGHVKCIEFDPRDPNTIYVAVEVGGAYKSTDAGKTWTQMEGVYEDVHRLLVAPSRPDNVYMSTGHDLYHSADAGSSWEIMPLPEHRIGYPDALVLLPHQPDLMFAAGGRLNPGQWRTSHDADAAIARSRDAGRTWEYLAGGLPSHFRGNVEAVTSNVCPDSFSLFAATTDGQLFTTEDAGDHWALIGEELPPISKTGHFIPLRPDLAVAR